MSPPRAQTGRSRGIPSPLTGTPGESLDSRREAVAAEVLDLVREVTRECRGRLRQGNLTFPQLTFFLRATLEQAVTLAKLGQGTKAGPISEHLFDPAKIEAELAEIDAFEREAARGGDEGEPE